MTAIVILRNCERIVSGIFLYSQPYFFSVMFFGNFFVSGGTRRIFYLKSLMENIFSDLWLLICGKFSETESFILRFIMLGNDAIRRKRILYPSAQDNIKIISKPIQWFFFIYKRTVLEKQYVFGISPLCFIWKS